MIAIIVAVAENGVIGGENRLLWHISEDLKHFKAVTTGHPVVMGRKPMSRWDVRCRGGATWSSRGRIFDRRVRRGAFARRGAGAFPPGREGLRHRGAQIYAQALPLCDEFYLTRVFHAYQGDTCFRGGMNGSGKLLTASRLLRERSSLTPLRSNITDGENRYFYYCTIPGEWITLLLRSYLFVWVSISIC